MREDIGATLILASIFWIMCLTIVGNLEYSYGEHAGELHLRQKLMENK